MEGYQFFGGKILEVENDQYYVLDDIEDNLEAKNDEQYN